MATASESASSQRQQVSKTAAFANPVPQSFAERKAAMNGHPRSTPLSQLVEGDNLMRGVTRPPPGDVSRPRKPTARAEPRKQRSAYFEDAFAAKETDPARERIHCESIVMAEVRTNVIISDEFTFITELSYHLSSRFQRPVSSIVVNLRHGVCMFFGGTFEPAYVMSIFALSSQLQPTTNKRNSALISKHMEESLGVAPPRGLLRFVPLQEENVAYNGKTVAWEIEDMEKASGCVEEANGAVPPKRTKSKNRLSMRSFASLRVMPIPELTPPASAESNNPSAPGLPTIPPSPSPTEEKPPSIKAAKRKYGFVSSILGRGLSRNENVPPLSKSR